MKIHERLSKPGRVWRSLTSERRKPGAYVPGVDGITVINLPDHLVDDIVGATRDDVIKFARMREVDMAERRLRVPTFHDRVVHGVIADAIREQIVLPRHVLNARGAKPPRGLRQLYQHRRAGAHVRRGDIRRFFDSIDNHQLVVELDGRIEPELLEMIAAILDASGFDTMGAGWALGSILADLFMARLDDALMGTNFRLRYVDDIVLVDRNLDHLLRQWARVKRVIHDLGLELHPDGDKGGLYRPEDPVTVFGLLILPDGTPTIPGTKYIDWRQRLRAFRESRRDIVTSITNHYGRFGVEVDLSRLKEDGGHVKVVRAQRRQE